MDEHEDLPLSCDMGVFDDAERAHHAQLLAQVLGAGLRRDETAGGYRFEFTDDTIYPVLAEWVSLEHRCCPFLDFGIELGPVRLALDLSGPVGVKELLRLELGLADLSSPGSGG